MIPKVIHYVWVGDAPKSDLVQKCIESWKKYCPDYVIKEWNNSSLAKINNLYVQQAFDSKKWAFVSDFLRLYALYYEGGFYCDTDLEITHSIDEFCNEKFVTGYQLWENSYDPITAFMGAEKNNKLIYELLSDYNDIPFIKNGEIDQTTNVTRILDHFAKKYDFRAPYDGTKKKELELEHSIYPFYYFCTPEVGKKNYSIHHFNGSWVDPFHEKKYFSLGNFKFVRIKRRDYLQSTEVFPEFRGFSLIFKLKINKNKWLCLLKRI